MVRRELSAYGHGLADKPEIVALNKADALSQDDVARQCARLRDATGKSPFVISAVSGQGVPDVLRQLLAIVDETRDQKPEQSSANAAWQP
jgi:GTP-binding protein